VAVPVVPEEDDRRGFVGVELGEGGGEVVQGAAEHSHVVGPAQIGNVGGLGGLLFHVSAEVGPSDSSAEPLLLVAEEMLGDVIGPLDDRDDVPVFVSKHGMAEEPVGVALEVVDDDDVGSDREFGGLQ